MGSIASDSRFVLGPYPSNVWNPAEEPLILLTGDEEMGAVQKALLAEDALYLKNRREEHMWLDQLGTELNLHNRDISTWAIPWGVRTSSDRSRTWGSVTAMTNDLLTGSSIAPAAQGDDAIRGGCFPSLLSRLYPYEADSLRDAFAATTKAYGQGGIRDCSEGRHFCSILSTIVDVLRSDLDEAKWRQQIAIPVPRRQHVAALARNIESGSSYVQARAIMRLIANEMELQSPLSSLVSRYDSGSTTFHRKIRLPRQITNTHHMYWEDLDSGQRDYVSSHILDTIQNTASSPVLTVYQPNRCCLGKVIKLTAPEQLACVQSTHGTQSIMAALGMLQTSMTEPESLDILRRRMEEAWEQGCSGIQHSSWSRLKESIGLARAALTVGDPVLCAASHCADDLA